MTLKEMIASKIAKQQALRDAAENEHRELSEDETRAFDELQNEIDSLQRALDEAETPPAKKNGEGNDDKDGTDGKDGKRDFSYSPDESAEISAMCRHFGINADEFFKRKLSIDEIRSEIISKQMTAGKPVTSHVTYGETGEDKRRSAAVDGFLLRSGAQIKNPADGANNYRGLSLREIAIECLERDGVYGDFRHMTADDVYAKMRSIYNPEGSFPAIMDEIVKKSYVEGQQQAGTQFNKFIKVGSLSNFKKSANHDYIISYRGELDLVPENGELKNYIPEDVLLPLRELKTYGRQFTLTRQAFIDDDIEMITTIPRRIARLSQNTQNKIVYNILLNKQNIFDDKPMFHTSRKNTLTAGSAPTLEVIQRMLFKIGIQTDEAENQLALIPNCFIVPLGLGAEVEKHLLTQTIISAEGTITNPLYEKEFEVIEDVSLNLMSESGKAVPWFMGVKGEFIQIDYLNGNANASIRRSEEAGKLGFVWDCWHDFGVSALHPNAICRNPGVTISDEGVLGS